jgi:hypothetical protein
VKRVDLSPADPVGAVGVRGIASAVAHRLARAWLSPARNAPWCWQDEGAVVAWRDGGTIAFAEEIAACARRLAPGGLPPLSALVLLLAAAGPDWPAHAGALAEWPAEADAEIARQRARALERLARLRGARGAVERAELAALVFPAGGHFAPGVAAAVIQGIDQGIPATQLEAGTAADPPVIWRLLADGLEGLDGAHFAAAARTGLVAPPAPAALPPPVAGGARGLIAALREDEQLGAMARLAQALLAAVHLPRPLSRPDELPEGGYAGIVNRGPLDRLLPAELAHDDLVLAARLAQGEALFLRRESPPSPRPRPRAILLDSGIRSWGVPRVFALAVALAFAGEARPGAAVRAWRAAGAEVAAVDLARREGLMDHLAALAPAPHPGAALAAWLDALGDDEVEEGDRVLVTHAAVVADPAFRAALAGVGRRWSPAWVATVAADGAYRLLSLAQGGLRVVAEARFDLADLLGERAGAVQAAAEGGALPVIFALRPFPLLLPHHLDPARAWHHPGRGVLAAAKDGRLMWWATPGQGARELLRRLPPGLPLWLGFAGGAAVALIAGAQGALTLVRVDAGPDGGGEVEVIPIATQGIGWPQAVEPVPGAHEAAPVLLVVGRHQVIAIAVEDGAVRGQLGLDERRWRWRRQRLFTASGRGGEEGWHLLHWDDARRSLGFVPAAKGEDPATELFLRDGRDGVWGLRPGGEVVDFAGGRRVHGTLPGGQYELKQLSHDGHRALVSRRHDGGSGDHLVAFDECRLLVGEAERLEPGIASLRRLSPNLVTRLDGVFAEPQPGGMRMPAFTTAKGALLRLTLHGDRLDLALAPRAAVPAHAEVVRFRAWRGAGVAGGHRGLELAEGPQTRCVLDPRGLVHFSDRGGGAPQLTVVLSDGASAFWSSDGSWGGAPFFLGRKPSNDPDRLREQLRRFAEGLP